MARETVRRTSRGIADVGEREDGAERRTRAVRDDNAARYAKHFKGRVVADTVPFRGPLILAGTTDFGTHWFHRKLGRFKT